MPGQAVLAAGAPSWVFDRPMGEYFAPPSPGPRTHLIDCVESDQEPEATIQEADKSFIIALAAYEAARKGTPVHVQ